MFRWAWEIKFFYLFIFLFVLGFWLQCVFLDYKLIDKIKVYGLVMQLMGAMTIIYSLYQKHILFSTKGNVFRGQCF